MAVAAPQHGVPALSSLTQVHIRQKTTFAAHKYAVTTADGRELFHAKEESSLGAFFGGNERSFKMTLCDPQGREVIKLRRPYTFGPDKMQVFVGSQLVSIVRQEMTFMTPVFSVNDPSDRMVLKVKGPKLAGGEVDYKVFTPNKVPVGVITKRWGGLAKEMFTSSDNFLISFPIDLHDNYKAALIGVCLLIDYILHSS